jgi:hypothetical protein
VCRGRTGGFVEPHDDRVQKLIQSDNVHSRI